MLFNAVSFGQILKMKFFSWLVTILIILLVIAAITYPGEQKFSNFINKNKGADTMSCKPIIGKTTQVKLLVKILSIYTVNYCDINKSSPAGVSVRMGKRTRGGDTSKPALKLSVPIVTGTETYLGLFGRFWKI